MDSIEQLKFPIGPFAYDDMNTRTSIPFLVDEIRAFPDTLQQLIQDIDIQKLEVPYRPGGWTGRQVIHHLHDSHTHALMRFKWALTEEKPSVLPYNEASFALLPDYALPAQVAVNGLIPIHMKWATIMDAMTEFDWDALYFHLGYQKEFTLRYALAMYVWHGQHHLGHIRHCLNP